MATSEATLIMDGHRPLYSEKMPADLTSDWSSFHTRVPKAASCLGMSCSWVFSTEAGYSSIWEAIAAETPAIQRVWGGRSEGVATSSSQMVMMDLMCS